MYPVRWPDYLFTVVYPHYREAVRAANYIIATQHGRTVWWD